MGHLAWDVICFLCTYQTVKIKKRQCRDYLPCMFWGAEVLKCACLSNDTCGFKQKVQCGFTFRHSSSTDISRHAAALEVCGMVAGHNLNLITGKVLQVGDDSWFFWGDFQFNLCGGKKKKFKDDHSYKVIFLSKPNWNDHVSQMIMSLKPIIW